MNKIIGLVILLFAGFALAALSTSAGAATLEGTVKDAAGHPIKDAVIRVEARSFSKVTTTDARGHYAANNLAVGSYKVTLLVNGQVKASPVNTKTENRRRTQLNFDLTGKSMAAAPPKKKTHMVWVPGQTGTLIGQSGRWIEVDENGVPVKDSQHGGRTDGVDTVSGTALQTVIRANTATRGGVGN